MLTSEKSPLWSFASMMPKDEIEESERKRYGANRYDGTTLIEDCWSRIFFVPLTSHEYVHNYYAYKYEVTGSWSRLENL